MTAPVVIPCRAKDPRTCPYHGAQLRANEALVRGNQDAYLSAMIDMMAAVKTTPEVNEFFNTELDQSTEQVLLTNEAAHIADEWANKSKLVVGSWKVLRYHKPEKASTYDLDLFVTRVGNDSEKRYYRLRLLRSFSNKHTLALDGVVQVKKVSGGPYWNFSEFDGTSDTSFLQ
jgi:hypothetical protein